MAQNISVSYDSLNNSASQLRSGRDELDQILQGNLDELVGGLVEFDRQEQLRNSFGHFFYRFTHGESGSDV